MLAMRSLVASSTGIVRVGVGLSIPGRKAIQYRQLKADHLLCRNTLISLKSVLHSDCPYTEGLL